MYSDQNPNLLNNYDQIKYLKFEGQYGLDCKKFGKWKTIWNGEFLKELGGYYQTGLKQGLWKELIRNYQSLAKVYEKGVYLNGQKYGMGNYIYKNQNIGGGFYNEQFKKKGKWIELSEGFCNMSQITYKGEYHKSKKVGIWNIYFLKELISDVKFQEIQLPNGEGTYDEGGGIKIGNWIEVFDKFDNLTQVTYNGQYKNGNKVGKWDILFEEEVIGGVTYDEKGELLYNGNYKNGNKPGRWDIEHDGGSYDEQGEGIKLGKWIELSDSFKSGSEVIYKGEYKNGVKVGRWNIKYREKKIGGGSYDEKGQGINIGNWIEVIDGFSFGSEITYDGQYKNGIKVGTWVEMNDWLHKEMIYDD
ncbi:unnamed protein product [Paramecium sonneborni]|uniref:MORN repeat protein n=1 Tax=Paramecium sonneborni TaxID=65129 RepID=A0A8S1PZ39_9CILI|nr:unnamed protein product [Paramecium sonneborni]